MAGMDAQVAADDAAVEAIRTKFGDAEAAKLAADLYKLRRTPAPAASSWSGLPRGIIILIAVWIGLLETAEKLPFLLLAFPQYEATLAEIQAKMLQPDLVKAQLDKARFEAKAAAFQPALVAGQAFKAEVDATASGATMEGGSSGRLGIMFDLLDPNHPNLVSKGLSTPDFSALLPYITVKKDKPKDDTKP